MKEDLKEIILMGLGAISMTGEKAAELKKELLEKGEAIYKQGAIKNEELKRNIKEKIKENIQYKSMTKEELIEIFEYLSDEEKEEILEVLKNNTKDEKKDE